jgi:ABC-type multidrug transport system fused ATPase/permease subunit
MEDNQVCEYKPCTIKSRFTFWDILKGFLFEQKFLFVLFIAILIAVPFKDVILPHYIGQLYDRIKNKENSKIKFTIAIIIGIVIFIQLIYIVSDYIRTLMLPLLQKYTREAMIKHVIEKHSNDFDEVKIGLIIATMMKLPILTFGLVSPFLLYVAYLYS